MEQVTAKIIEKSGEALVVQADIRFLQEAKRAVRETLEAFHRIDVLVNSAGVMLLGPAREASLDEWQRMTKRQRLHLRSRKSHIPDAFPPEILDTLPEHPFRDVNAIHFR